MRTCAYVRMCVRVHEKFDVSTIVHGLLWYLAEEIKKLLSNIV